MFVHGLRLLVALITFGVGVTASSLLSLKRAVKSERPVKACKAVLVSQTLTERTLLGSPGNPYLDEQGVGNRGIINPLDIRSKPAPTYPPLARAARAEGAVVVRVMVDEDGDVTSAQAVSGHPLLRQAAVSAARRATFVPLRLSGETQKFSGLLVYTFVPE
jgi:TonB family protein